MHHRVTPDSAAALRSWEWEGGGLARAGSFARSQKPARFTKLRNDGGVAEILIGMKEFECVGVSPPHDHPHIYLFMGLATTMLCPYCATAFRFDSALAPDEVMPAECRYAP